MSEPDDSSTRISNATASSIVNSLPELIELIGQDLSPSDLVACVQVCRLWNQTLLPLVWHAVNPEKQRAWQSEKVEQWTRISFVNNCHLIRNLTANWDVLLETAAAQCRNLTSLTVHGVRHILPEHFHTSSPSSCAADSTIANDQSPSVELPWITKQSDDVQQDTPQERRDLELFWQLVLQNPGLVRLHFPQTTVINILPQAYILETVSRIKNLRELNTRLMNVDLSTLLDSLPQLERLSCSPSLGSVTLSKNYSNLRQLKYLRSVQVSMFIEVLKHLPTLESLMLSRIIAEEDLPTSTYEILCETVSTAVVTFPQVREFEVHWMSPHEERYVAVMLGVFPEVRRLYLPRLSVGIRKVMWERHYWLEEFKDRSDGIVDEWKERRAKDAAGVRL
ncbi:hypothetical protein BKA57DRAFT_469260 [Linnemannia elongata]|nr:hypothetical protein BKA57DRAFT_469260 [Linnemannia elongata]